MSVFNISGFERMIEAESYGLAARINSRKGEMFFRPAKSYDGKDAETAVRESFEKLISSGWSRAELAREYETARSYRGLIFFSPKLLFIRHTAGLAVLPLVKISGVSFSRRQVSITRICTLTVSYGDAAADEFDFLFDGDNLRWSTPGLSYEDFSLDFGYIVNRAISKALNPGQDEFSFDVASDECDDLFAVIAEKEYASDRKLLLNIRKKNWIFVTAGFLLTLVLLAAAIYLGANEDWIFFAFLPIIMVYTPALELYSMARLLALDLNGFLSNIKSHIITYAGRLRKTCSELCELYLHSEAICSIALIRRNWLILRGNARLIFVNLDEVLGFYVRKDFCPGINSCYKNYLMLKFFDGHEYFFEFGDLSPAFFCKEKDVLKIQKTISAFPWISLSETDSGIYGGWEKLAVESAKKLKAFYQTQP